jgi:hypothetical protein
VDVQAHVTQKERRAPRIFFFVFEHSFSFAYFFCSFCFVFRAFFFFTWKRRQRQQQKKKAEALHLFGSSLAVSFRLVVPPDPLVFFCSKPSPCDPHHPINAKDHDYLLLPTFHEKEEEE